MYQIDKTSWGAFVARLRKEKGLTQKELAQRLLVSDKAVSKWETGTSLPDTQLLIPTYSYCVPDKECTCGCGCGADPCELFRSIAFPVDEFFPPNAVEKKCDYESAKCSCCCSKR